MSNTWRLGRVKAEEIKMDPKQNPLMKKMHYISERYTMSHPKPQNVPFDEIVTLVADFMKSAEEQRIAFSFGNEVGEHLEDKNDARFDPIALYDACPDQLDNIIMFVDHDMEFNEQELLSRQDKSLYAYNTLVFGAAIRLERKEALSKGLRAFLVDHLIASNPPKEAGTGKRERPKNKNDKKLFRYFAIKFAELHGMKPTRNDETKSRQSACDAVKKAADMLYHSKRNPSMQLDTRMSL